MGRPPRLAGERKPALAQTMESRACGVQGLGVGVGLQGARVRVTWATLEVVGGRLEHMGRWCHAPRPPSPPPPTGAP